MTVTALDEHATHDQLALFTEHLWLPPERCRILGVRGPALDDAAQEGRLALWRAANRFDADRGVPFRRYARVWVDGAIKETLCQLGPVRIPVKVASARAVRGERIHATGLPLESCGADGCSDSETTAAYAEHEMVDWVDHRRARAWMFARLSEMPRRYAEALCAMAHGIGTIEYAARAGMHRDTARLHAKDGLELLRSEAAADELEL